jgi:hypothetical protein
MASTYKENKMRVVWTRAEKDEVFGNMIQVAVDRPHLASKDLMREAQQVLPSHRKTVVSDQRVFTYKKMIEGAREAAAKIRANRKTEEQPASVQPVLEPELRKEPTLADQLQGLLDMIADKVADRVMERVQQQLRVEIVTDGPKPEAVPEKGWLDELMALSIRKQPPKHRKTTCLIVGLNGAQIETIQQHKPDVDFTFVTGEQALSHHTFNKDHTILMTKFINHGVHSKYRKHPNMHYCNGGVSELKTLMNGIFGRVSV